MANSSSKIDVEKLMSYSNELIQFMKDAKDASNMAHQLEQSKPLQSQCDEDYEYVQNLVQDYPKKINECKEKLEAARSESEAVGDVDSLEKEFEEELQKDRLLKRELRDINNEMNDLEIRRIFNEELRHVRQKLEQDELKTQMKLSMYASVTNIIPNLDNVSKFSGYFVQRDENRVGKFEFDTSNGMTTPFDNCNTRWKMINP